MNGQDVHSIRKAYHPELVILVVEDHLVFSKGLKHALTEHKIIFSRSVEDAKQCYDEHLPDITFLDIDLPDASGFELLDYIHAREPEAYVIVLTGSKLPEDIATSRQKGAQDYIIKPFTKARIEQTIGKYLVIRERKIQDLLAETSKHRHDAVAAPLQADNLKNDN